MNPRHGLTWEEMLAYVDRVLRNPNNWMVHSTALLIKARLESQSSRTVDKALMQLQVRTFLKNVIVPTLIILSQNFRSLWINLQKQSKTQNQRSE